MSVEDYTKLLDSITDTYESEYVLSKRYEIKVSDKETFSKLAALYKKKIDFSNKITIPYFSIYKNKTDVTIIYKP